MSIHIIVQQERLTLTKTEFDNWCALGNYKEYHWHDIININCTDAALDHLPQALPESLQGLYCSKNILSYLPPMPRNLREFECIESRLEELLPDFTNCTVLERINASFNFIKQYKNKNLTKYTNIT